MAHKKHAYPTEFLTPLNVQRPGPEHGPEVSNVAPVTIPDPLGVVPKGGNSSSGLSGGASKPLPGHGKE